MQENISLLSSFFKFRVLILTPLRSGCGKGKKQRKVEDELDDESRKVEEESRNLAVRKVIKRKCDELGPINFHEGSVLVAFLTCMLLWFFRSPGTAYRFL